MTAVLRVLSLPGWRGSPPEHGQSLWERLHGHLRVEPADWVSPRRGAWMARLEDILPAEERPALLVAHNLECRVAAAAP